MRRPCTAGRVRSTRADDTNTAKKCQNDEIPKHHELIVKTVDELPRAEARLHAAVVHSSQHRDQVHHNRGNGRQPRRDTDALMQANASTGDEAGLNQKEGVPERHERTVNVPVPGDGPQPNVRREERPQVESRGESEEDDRQQDDRSSDEEPARARAVHAC